MLGLINTSTIFSKMLVYLNHLNDLNESFALDLYSSKVRIFLVIIIASVIIFLYIDFNNFDPNDDKKNKRRAMNWLDFTDRVAKYMNWRFPYLVYSCTFLIGYFIKSFFLAYDFFFYAFFVIKERIYNLPTDIHDFYMYIVKKCKMIINHIALDIYNMTVEPPKNPTFYFDREISPGEFVKIEYTLTDEEYAQYKELLNSDATRAEISGYIRFKLDPEVRTNVTEQFENNIGYYCFKATSSETFDLVSKHPTYKKLYYENIVFLKQFFLPDTIAEYIARSWTNDSFLTDMMAYRHENALRTSPEYQASREYVRYLMQDCISYR